jgi:hypothetical protein
MNIEQQIAQNKDVESCLVFIEKMKIAQEKQGKSEEEEKLREAEINDVGKTGKTASVEAPILKVSQTEG